MERNTMGSFIAALRRSRGLTQKELGDMLGVSDKAVSRWERDETAPDISLLPVIADIFGVTADELLRGEKSAEKAVSGFTQKSEVRIKYLIDKATSRFRIVSIISVGIAVLAMVAAALCNYIFFMVHLAFGTGTVFAVGTIFNIVAILLESIIAVHTISAVKTHEESLEENTICAKIKIFKTAYLIISLEFSLIFSLIPLLFERFYIEAATWLVYGAAGFAAGALICAIIYIFVRNRLIKNTYQSVHTPEMQKRKENAHLAKKLTAIALCIVLVLGTAQLTFSMLDYTVFSKGKVFTDLESFEAYMAGSYDPDVTQYVTNEEPTATFDETPIDSGSVPVYDEYNVPTGAITDKDGNIIHEFVFRNHDVLYFDVDNADADNFRARVYTDKHRAFASSVKVKVNLFSPVIYLTVAIVFLVLYKKKKIS